MSTALETSQRQPEVILKQLLVGADVHWREQWGSQMKDVRRGLVANMGWQKWKKKPFVYP